MSSSPKSSLSCSKRTIYSGAGGKGELIDAINFLFQLKGQEYQKKHAGFITPSAEEFLTYATKVNEDFRKLKKHSPLRKSFAFSVTKPVRPVSVPKQVYTNDIFYAYITPWAHGDDPSHHLLQCFTIVVFALTIYNFTKESLRMYAEHDKIKLNMSELFQSATTQCRSSVHSAAFQEPFHWFLHSHMSTLAEHNEYLFSVLNTFVCEKLLPILPKQLSSYTFPKEHIACSLGTALTTIITTLMMIPQSLDYCVTLPIFVFLTRNGYEECKHICGDALSRCKQGPNEDIL